MSTVKRHHLALLQAGLLHRLPEGDESKGFTYSLCDQEEYHQLKSNITTVLDTILSNILANQQQVTSSSSAQTTTESVKPKPITGKKQNQPTSSTTQADGTPTHNGGAL